MMSIHSQTSIRRGTGRLIPGVAILAILMVSACSADRPEAACAGDPITDLSREPEFHSTYLSRWQKGACDVRLDVLMTREGSDFCDGKVRQIVIALPENGSPEPLVYVRDPSGFFGDKGITNRLDLDAMLPGTAERTPYTQNGSELWLDPSSQAFIYIHEGGDTERWPRDDEGLGCG